MTHDTRHFLFKHFPKSKIISESRYLKNYYVITIQNFFLDQYFKKSKNEFPIVFSNLARPMVGFFFIDTIWVF